MWIYRSAISIFTILCLAGSIAPAGATLWIADDATAGANWSQRFLLDDVGTFDYLRVDLIDEGGPVQFDPPVFRTFSSGGWGDQASSSLQGIASGPESQSLSFDLFFTECPLVGIAFRFAAYEEIAGVFHWRDAALARHTGGEDGYWKIRQLMQDEWDPTGTIQPIPEASTLLLMGPGLALILYGMMRRRGPSR